MRTRPKVSIPIAVALFIALLLAPVSQARAWEWTLIPYLWGSDVSMDVAINNDPILGVDVSFSDLLDKLDYAAQIHFEGRRNKGGFFIDTTFLGISEDQTIEGAEISSEMDLTMVELGGFYGPGGASDGFNWIFGARITEIEQQFDITLPLPPEPSTTVKVEPSIVDGFVGFRYRSLFADSWAWAIRFDVGAGDSDLAYNGVAGLWYTFGSNQQFSVILAYRALQMEYEERDGNTRTEIDMGMSGPALGFRIGW